MFDIGFVELLVVGIVALIVVGPKDLPGLFRTLGRFTARLRSLGKEFTSAMNSAADESGMREASKELKGLTSPRSYGLDKLNEAADAFDKWEPKKPGKAEGEEKPAAKPLDPERQADIDKIREATQKAGQARLDREKAEKAVKAGEAKKPVRGKPPERPKPKPKAEPAGDTKPAGTAEKKPAAKKPAGKKTATKKPAAKKPAAKAASVEAPKPTSKAASARKAQPKKTTAAKTPAKSDKADDA